MKSVSISTEGTSPSLSSFSRPRRHSLSEKKRPKRGRPSPTVVALTALWVLALVANFSLDIVLDLFQGHFQANEFPFVPIVFANILLGVFGVVIVLLVGKLSYKEYSVFQPFYGGRSFVFSQAAAYFILASAMALKFVLIRVSLITGTTTIYYGTFTVVGVFTLLSQVLLMTSLLFFEPGRKQKTAPSRERTLVAKNEILFIVTCNVVMLSCSLGAEAYPVFKPVNVFVTGMLSIAALLAIERITTNNEVKSYHFFTPTMETLTLFVGQCFANGLLLSGFAISGFLYFGSTEAAAGYHALCTMLLAGGICVHLIVLRLVVQHRSRTVEDLSSDVRVNLFAGPLLASLVNVLLVCAVVVLHTVHSGALSAYSASWAVALKELAEMTPELTIYMFVLMLFLPPFTHVQGRFIYTKDFRVWQPFSGTTEFILLQMAGWAAYGVLMFFGILSANATDETKQVYTLIFCGASILSQVCIHSSLYLFKLSEQAPNSPTSVSDTAPIDLVQADSRSFIPQSEENSMAAVVFNKEMMVAFALGIVAITIRVVCDSLLFLRSPVPTFQLTIGQSWRSYDFTREAFVSASTFLCLLSTLAAQLSIRHSVSPKINLSNGFVALQTFGWTFFSILAVAILSFYVLEGNVSLALQYVDHPGYMLWLTMEGFLEGIPFISFLLSGIFEFDALLAQKGSQKKVQASVGEVRKLLANKGVSTAESELCEQLLRAIAGPRLATAEELSASRRDEDSDLLSETAKVVSTIISVACVAIFSVAFLLSTTHPLVSLLFLVIGILLFTLSCVSIHVMYGGQLHRKSTHYSYFMPFTGGKQFVSLQAGGWVTYAISVLLVLTAVVEGKPASITCLLLSPLSVVSQTLLLLSVPTFKDREAHYDNAFIGRNAEGILALLTFIGTFFFLRMYETAREGRTTEDTVSFLPLVISALSAVVIIPIGLLYIRHQSKIFGFSPLQMLEGLDDEDEDEAAFSSSSALNLSGLEPGSPHSPLATSIRHRQETAAGLWSDTMDGMTTPLLPRTTSQYGKYTSRTVATLLSIVFVLAIFVLALVPLVFVLWGYMAQYEPDWVTSDNIASILQSLLLVFLALVLLPALSIPFLKKLKFLKGVHNTVCAFLIYSIPTITVLGGITPPLFSSTLGARLFAFNMCSMALLSTLPYVHLTAFVFSIIAFAYFTQYHLYVCLYQQREPFQLLVAFTDILCSVFWIWYDGRYSGRPEISGRLRSPKAIYLFKNFFFEGMANYFSLKVIISSSFVIKSEQEFLTKEYRPPRVDMRDPNNQYMFSFHPHGVFPGTAIYGPKTNLWDHTVGYNSKTTVTTHCADIVFSVPLMREFPLLMSAMSVSRKGIASSISQGHSPLIVTGGQSEMLLTAVSNKEMHLVCHHLGFLKLALKHKIPLTPVLSFAESNILDNVHCLRVQRWFLKMIAFPFPTLPLGRWGLPLPRNSPTTLVIGQPLLPLPGRDDPNDPSCVEELRLRYFEHLEVLFYKYRAEAGYPEMKLFLHNGVYDEGVEAIPPDTALLEEGKTNLVVNWFQQTPSAVRRAVSKEKVGDKPKGKEKVH